MKVNLLFGVCIALLSINIGAQPNEPPTIAELTKSAEAGNAEAQYQLGNAYRKGQGVKQSFFLATQWYRKAAEQKHPKAFNNLGLCYEYGKGVRQDYRNAHLLYGLGCDLGNEAACSNYARLNRYRE